MVTVISRQWFWVFLQAEEIGFRELSGRISLFSLLLLMQQIFYFLKFGLNVGNSGIKSRFPSMCRDLLNFVFSKWTVDTIDFILNGFQVKP